MTNMTPFAAAVAAFHEAARRYREACAEIALLDALPYRDGFMRARQQERRDWERKARFAVRGMRACCKETAAVWTAMDAKTRRAVMIEVRKASEKMARSRQKERVA